MSRRAVDPWASLRRRAVDQDDPMLAKLLESHDLAIATRDSLYVMIDGFIKRSKDPNGVAGILERILERGYIDHPVNAGANAKRRHAREARQRKARRMRASGGTNAQIAEALGVTVRTVSRLINA